MKSPESNPFPLLFAVMGFCLMIAGIGWIYRPAALITAGILLMTLAFFGRRGSL